MDRYSHSSNEAIRITIECHTEPGALHFDVSPQLCIRQFLEQVLEQLAKGTNAERARTLRDYYEPVLELCAGSATIPLDSEVTLEQAGVAHGAVCRISARPLKDRIMFCNNL